MKLPVTRKLSVKEGACSTRGWLVGWEVKRGRKDEGVTCKTALSLWQHNGVLLEKAGSSSMSVVTKFAPTPTPTVEETVVETRLLLRL